MAFLLCLVIAYMIQKTWVDGRTDQELARKGIVSPRLQAKYGDGAKAKTSQYGLVDYLADAWSDNWRNRTEIRRSAEKAVAEVKPSKPGRAKPSWRDRLGAAKKAVVEFGRKVAQPVEVRPKAAPPPAPTKPAVPAEDVDTARTCPDCGAKLTRQNAGWWHPDGPDCPERPATKPLADPPCGTCRQPFSSHVITDIGGDEPVPVCPTGPRPAQPKEKPVTAPTGEAVNYETTVNELQAMVARARTWLEQVTAALKSLEEAKNHISDGQTAYREVAGAVPTMLQFLASKHLDATTLGLIGAIKEAMPASDIDAALAAIEEAETFLKKLVTNAQTALDALEAALAHIQGKYSTAEETVQNDLGGDSSFLGNGAATSVAA